jgi:hypothetical protein
MNQQIEAVRCKGDPVLINIYINTNSFLGHILERIFPLHYLNQQGQSLPKERTKNIRTNTVNITFKFTSKLKDKNRVLNKGQLTLLLDILEYNKNSRYYEATKHITHNIIKALQPELFTSQSSIDQRRIHLSQAEFRAVTHEVVINPKNRETRQPSYNY